MYASGMSQCDATERTSPDQPDIEHDPTFYPSSETIDTSGSDFEDSDSQVSDAPPNPFPVGFTITAMRHEPPDPIGRGYTTPVLTDYPDWRNISKEQLCFAHPFILAGHTVTEDTRVLTVTSIIRAGHSCGPQLVVVNHDLVAKIYDPLHFNGLSDNGFREDVVWNADSAYTREAAAYKHIWKFGEVTDLVPSFHGTWTMNLKATLLRGDELVQYTRPVRLILMEHLRGQCMESVSAQSLKEKVRSSILKQCLDAEARLYHAGIGHHDFCPRNVILVGQDYETPDLQVKVIDFGSATVYKHPRYVYRNFQRCQKRLEAKQPVQVTSPFMRNFGHLIDFSYLGWCPKTDEWDEEIWLWDQYRNDTRYKRVYWDPSQPETKPKYLNSKGVSGNDSD